MFTVATQSLSIILLLMIACVTRFDKQQNVYLEGVLIIGITLHNRPDSDDD